MHSTAKIVGILNITPDSFSDGGLAGNYDAILNALDRLIKDGADVIDIGAESTRPGATPITHEEEWQRLEACLPEICKIAGQTGVLTSIDTRHAQTASLAIKCGIGWVNDVGGLDNPQMLEAVANWHGKIVVMHNLGVPADKNIIIPADKDAVTEIHQWFANKITYLASKGIKKERVILDPGIGFGKNSAQSIYVLENIARFKDLGAEIFVGHSRKSFLPGSNGLSIVDKDQATLEISRQLAANGVDYLRVHNVAAHRGMLGHSRS